MPFKARLGGPVIMPHRVRLTIRLAVSIFDVLGVGYRYLAIQVRGSLKVIGNSTIR